MNFDKAADYILHLNDPNPIWIIQEKEKVAAPLPDEFKFKSVGQFRKDLNRLKVLRKGFNFESTNKPKLLLQVIREQEEKEKDDFMDMTYNEDISGNLNIITCASTPGTLTELKLDKIRHIDTLWSSGSASNPLTDQTIKVIKPSKWIDCISRESKRIFVKDNWIVARILEAAPRYGLVHPMGLKRLCLE